MNTLIITVGESPKMALKRAGEALKAGGPMTIYALAKKPGRHYRNVYKDVAALTAWLAIEKNADGLVFVPWDEIDVRWSLAMAA